MSMRRMSVLAVAPMAALLLTGAVAAQDEDSSDSLLGPRLITPEECQVGPLPVDEVAATLSSTEAINPVTFQVPLGEPADTQTTDAVVDEVRSVIACLNAGDYLRGAALATDNGARVLFSGLAANGPEALNERLAAEPTARPEQAYVRLITITDVSVLEDGNVAAFVVINEPTRPPRGQETLLFTFSQDNDQLLLDNLIGFTVVPPEALGTPVAGATPAA